MAETEQKVAIVCDWLTNQGGAERVVVELHRMYPDAPIYTSVYNRNGRGMEAFKDAAVKTSFIQHLPWAKTKHQLYPVLRRIAFQRFDFSDYDLVISSSGAEAKGIKTVTPTIHVNYCHSPTHYYWVRPREYMQADTMGWLGKVLRLGLRVLIKPMRRWDYLAAQRPDFMIANSSITQARIKKHYDRDTEVIFPPVDIERFAPPDNPPKRRGFVVLGRQVHYKRLDLAVTACSQLGLLLRVIGSGPEHENLKSIAGPTIEFYEDLTDEEVAEALWHAEGLISCGVEDFGITAVEALAAGAPVLAFRGGGVVDIVKEDKSGMFFDKQSTESLIGTLRNFEASQFDSAELIKASNKFSVEKFQGQVRLLANDKMNDA